MLPSGGNFNIYTVDIKVADYYLEIKQCALLSADRSRSSGSRGSVGHEGGS